VEDLLSKRAEEAANRGNVRQDRSKVFQDESQQQRADDVDLEEDDRHDSSTSTPHYKYKPPQAVQKRQFCSMARWAGYGQDVVSFALVVENWTQAERRECLDRFYRARRNVLQQQPSSFPNEVLHDRGGDVDVKVPPTEVDDTPDVKPDVKIQDSETGVVVKREREEEPGNLGAAAIKTEVELKVELKDEMDVETASEDEDDEL